MANLLKAMLLLFVVINALRAERCAPSIPCKVCIVAAGCSYYVGVRNFCGDHNLGPRLFQFKINKLQGCAQFDSEPAPFSRSEINQPTPTTTTEAAPVKRQENDGLGDPITLPVSADPKSNTKNSTSEMSPSRRVKETTKTKQKETFPDIACKQYIYIFKNLHQNKKGNKEFQRCVIKLQSN